MSSRIKPLARLWVSAELSDSLRAEANRCFPLETGGVLLGYTRDHEAVVTSWIGPGETATHRRWDFIPHHEYQEKAVAEAYEQSRGTSTYLGDWHTHPCGGPALSHLDRKTLRSISRAPEARLRQPLMVILFGESPWRIAAWQWPPMARLAVLGMKALPVPIRYG